MRYLLPLLLSLAACSNDPSPLGCTPGAQLACACPGGPSSVQVCTSAGTLGTCACPDAGSPDVAPGIDAGAGDVQTPDVPAIVDAPPSPPDGCTSTTAGNCCGVACPAVANAMPGCIVGACGIGSCLPGFGDCDGNPANGCEVELATDAAHCGACRAACSSDRTCVGSSCVACSGLRIACAGTCIDPQTNPAHCGGCNAPCATRPNAVTTCVAGGCGFTCMAGFADCDGVAANGCESTNSDTTNCGTCGNACAAGVMCIDGRCGCPAGRSDCDGNPATVCETNTAMGDIANCGGCGTRCPTPPRGATMVCVAGSCRISTVVCTAGIANCDGNDSNGCETTTLSDVNNCGACRRSCALLNATAACVAGTCSVSRCNVGFVDCDRDPATGCESYPPSDYRNCGACGQSCPVPPHAGPACRGGVCSFDCYGGWADCNRDPSDGCEQNIDPDTLGSTTCRACGTRCGSNCYDLQTQRANCGTCGHACTGLYFCRAGACVCPAGLSDCGGDCVDTSGSDNNCGACGNRCLNGRVCRSGACVYV